MPFTLEFIRQHYDATRHPTLAFTNEDGGPLWNEIPKEDSTKSLKIDNIKSMYERYCRKQKIKKAKPLKRFRKTAASKLEEHESYGRYVQHFLGHTPRSIADRHYVQPSQEQFDKAIIWLSVQFGIK